MAARAVCRQHQWCGMFVEVQAAANQIIPLHTKKGNVLQGTVRNQVPTKDTAMKGEIEKPDAVSIFYSAEFFIRREDERLVYFKFSTRTRFFPWPNLPRYYS
eukprot:scaffold561_cov162-Amphora_coffeaeformis.AAC.9